jgi:probable selenium-dependent hydroxylase accessory protein YqeC
MWSFHRIEPIRLLAGQQFIAVVGAGGKSTLIEYIAAEQALAGKTVAVTTTTRIYAKEPFVLFSDMAPVTGQGIVRVGKTHEGEKLTGLTFDEVRSLGDMVDIVLIEADGAKHCPLKYPAHHEPLIPPFSDRVCVVAGLDALYGRVKEQVFRWKLLHDATGVEGDAVISEDMFVSLFSDQGMLKDVEKSKCTVILNKYDVPGCRQPALKLAKRLIRGERCPEVILSSAFLGLFYGVRRV